MSATRFVIVMLVLGIALWTVAPAAQARSFCSNTIDPWCPGVYCKPAGSGSWDCRLFPIECIRDGPPCGAP